MVKSVRLRTGTLCGFPYRNTSTAALGALFLTVLMSACNGGGRSPLPDIPDTTAIGDTSGHTSYPHWHALGRSLRGEVGWQRACGGCPSVLRRMRRWSRVDFTDGDGAYSFNDVKTAVYPLWVAKQGYDLAKPTGRAGTGWLGSINAEVNGDTRFDIELVRR